MVYEEGAAWPQPGGAPLSRESRSYQAIADWQNELRVSVSARMNHGLHIPRSTLIHLLLGYMRKM